MSRSRNRNVRKSLPTSDLYNFTVPKSNNNFSSNITKKYESNEDIFGENVQRNENIRSNLANKKRLKDIQNWTLSSGENSDDSLVNLKLDESICDISSSSSLSWSDEYETEASKKVQEELLLLDRIFRGLQTIPINYDKEELEEWMEMFPNLSIIDFPTDQKSNAKPLSKESPSKETIQAQLDCDIRNTSKEITEAVIKKIYENVSNKLLNERAAPTSNHVRNYYSHSRQPKVFEPNSYLKISQIKRYPSSKSVLEQKVSRRSFEDSPDYISLPILSEGMRKTPKNVNRKIDQFILPPIENNFRSVSANLGNQPMLSVKTTNNGMMIDQKEEVLLGNSRKFQKRSIFP